MRMRKTRIGTKKNGKHVSKQFFLIEILCTHTFDRPFDKTLRLFLSNDLENYSAGGWIRTTDKLRCYTLRINFLFIRSAFIFPWKRTASQQHKNHTTCTLQQPRTHDSSVFRILQFITSFVNPTATTFENFKLDGVSHYAITTFQNANSWHIFIDLFGWLDRNSMHTHFA